MYKHRHQKADSLIIISYITVVNRASNSLPCSTPLHTCRPSLTFIAVRPNIILCFPSMLVFNTRKMCWNFSGTTKAAYTNRNTHTSAHISQNTCCFLLRHDSKRYSYHMDSPFFSPREKRALMRMRRRLSLNKGSLRHS